MIRPLLTPSVASLLDQFEWGEEHFGSLLTGRTVRRDQVRRAVAAGVVESAGMVVVCDDDGFAREPERWREGFKLTDAGRAALAEWRAISGAAAPTETRP